MAEKRKGGSKNSLWLHRLHGNCFQGEKSLEHGGTMGTPRCTLLLMADGVFLAAESGERDGLRWRHLEVKQKHIKLTCSRNDE